MVAPSDMMDCMDNRIGAIKKPLDENRLGGKVQGLFIWSPVHSNGHQYSSHFSNECLIMCQCSSFQVAVMSYGAKFASGFYGPFRFVHSVLNFN